MKISVITVVRNAQDTIADTLISVSLQRYPDIEHIVIDGASTDGTVSVIEQYKGGVAIFVSEPDSGIYDAMNKGIELASGDVIGFLNADDVYQDSSVLDTVAQVHADGKLDACYADLVYVEQSDLSKVVRDWRSQDYVKGLSFRGWMPAHPTFYLKKRVYEKVGLFNTQLAYQADLEFCARAFEIHRIHSRYVPSLWVRMRVGGVTNNHISDILKGNWESYKALKKIGLKRNPISFFTIKWGSKLPQFLPKLFKQR